MSNFGKLKAKKNKGEREGRKQQIPLKKKKEMVFK